ncbi:DUF6503 family protein [Flavobacterium sp. Arc3]|uniref:DUF6503 family protein n=1 Tax=Flavobacterium sp. Arc3 TaxID=3046686 RepID=UPI00352D2E59
MTLILPKTGISFVNRTILLLCLLVFFKTSAQEISGEQLLERAIHYHDPQGNWDHFKGKLTIGMTMPNGTERLSEISIDFPNQYFKLAMVKNDKTVEYSVTNGTFLLSLDGKNNFTEEEIKTYNLTEARTKFMQNYYTYLYGLPMKLKDPGTIIDSAVEKKEFLGKEYLVLKVKYEEGVGKDAWFFYFDPKTYALKVYQFYHDETKKDGEYILLSDEEEFSGIKIPKVRAWYLNKDGSYLATDTLTKVSKL